MSDNDYKNKTRTALNGLLGSRCCEGIWFLSKEPFKMFQNAYDLAERRLDRVPRKYKDASAFIHSRRVALLTASWTGSTWVSNPESIQAALLHDIIEDGGITDEQLIEEVPGIADGSPSALDYIHLLTNDVDEIKKHGYIKYMTEKMKQMPDECLIIKLCDMLDNMAHTKSHKFIQTRMTVVRKVRYDLSTCQSGEKYVASWKKKMEEIYSLMCLVEACSLVDTSFIDSPCILPPAAL